MRLGGWQRVWVVLVVPWALVVVLVGYSRFPTPGSVSHGEVYAGMPTIDGGIWWSVFGLRRGFARH